MTSLASSHGCRYSFWNAVTFGQQNFERLFLISWENNRDCYITTPLSMKTMEVQIKGDQWNNRFRTVQVYWSDPTPIERLFLIGWENNRDCYITTPLSLKTMEVQIKGDQWNNRFRTVQVYWSDPTPIERLFLIGWENNRDCYITTPLSLKTMEVQIKGDQWNNRFRTVQVYWTFQVDVKEGRGMGGGGGWSDLNVKRGKSEYVDGP